MNPAITMQHDNYGNPANDQLQAFLQDAARIDRERADLLQRGRLSAGERKRLSELDKQAAELIRTARQQGLLLPMSQREGGIWPASWPGRVGVALLLMAGSVLVAGVLGAVLVSLGFIPIFIMALAFVFILGLIIGREFPYKK